MLTYTKSNKTVTPQSNERPWLLLLLTFIWLWPGIFSHDLWNPSEPKIFTAISSILLSGNSILPNIYGQPFIETPPLYIILGTLYRKFFIFFGISPYTSVRLLTTTLMTIALLLAGIAGRNLLGRKNGRTVVMLLLGCIGIILFGHLISELSLLFLSLSLFLWGISLTLHHKNIFHIGLVIGSSWILTFYSENISMLLTLMIISSALLIHQNWKNSRYVLVLFIAFMFSLPFILIWPFALFTTNSEIFYIWLGYYSLGPYGGFHSFNLGFSPLYYLENILWYAFPAFPIAIWAIIKQRKKIPQDPTLFISLTWLIIGTMYLIFQKNPNKDQLIFIILPLTILSVGQIDYLKRGYSAFINWLGIMSFGSIALFLWIGYAAIHINIIDKLAERAAYFSPYYAPEITFFPIFIALAFTPVWIIAVTRKNIKGRQALTNWAAGVTFIWTLLFTLFLPWLDAAKSYRPVVKLMEKSLPKQIEKKLMSGAGCIESTDINALIAWNQYSKFKINSSIANPNNQFSCKYRIAIQNGIVNKLDSNNKIIWSGFRPRNEDENFIFYEKY